MAKVKQHDIDLYRSYKVKKQREVRIKKKVAMKTGMIAFSIVMAGLLAGGCLYEKNRLDDINAQVEEYDILMSDPDLIERNTTMTTLTRQFDTLDELYKTIAGHRLMMTLLENKFDYLTEDFFDNVYECCSDDIEMTKYQISGYYFTGEFETSDSKNVPDFVARLRATGMFSEISYEGFLYDEQEAVTDPNNPAAGNTNEAAEEPNIIYSFAVNCRFKTGGGVQ